MSKCLDNALKKELELPKLINEVVKALTGKSFVKEFDTPKNTRKMRSAEEILKDYGLGGVKRG